MSQEEKETFSAVEIPCYGKKNLYSCCFDRPLSFVYLTVWYRYESYKMQGHENKTALMIDGYKNNLFLSLFIEV